RIVVRPPGTFALTPPRPVLSTISLSSSANREREQNRVRSVHDKGAENGRLRPDESNSLIPRENSLFFEILSLLICVGNCSKNGCSAAASSGKTGVSRP